MYVYVYNQMCFRPWYAEIATSTPKDVVLLIDRTTEQETFDIAKDAAKIVIATLNPKDRVTT